MPDPVERAGRADAHISAAFTVDVDQRPSAKQHPGRVPYMVWVVEFTVEPFTEGSPGPHVQAAVDAAEASGVTVEFGPFGTTVVGDDPIVLDAVDAIVR